MASDLQKGRGTRRGAQKERFWREQVQGQASSGLSVRAWCSEHGLSEPSFYAWRRELVERDGQRSAPARRSAAVSPPKRRPVQPVGNVPPRQPGALLPVTLLPGTAERIELQLPSGLVIRVPVDQAALAAVWQLLTDQPPC